MFGWRLPVAAVNLPVEAGIPRPALVAVTVCAAASAFTPLHGEGLVVSESAVESSNCCLLRDFSLALEFPNPLCDGPAGHSDSTTHLGLLGQFGSCCTSSGR